MQSGPDRESPGTPGRLHRRSRPVPRSSRSRPSRTRCRPTRPRARPGCAQKTNPLSYGTFSHLWPSQPHESASSSPAHLMRRSRAGRGPESEGTVDVRPPAVLVDQVAGLAEGIARAGVHVPACRQTISGAFVPDDRPRPQIVPRSMTPFAFGCGRVRAHPEPNPSNRSDRSIVACRSSPASSRTRGAPIRPVRLHVPAGLRQHVIPSRRQPHGVGGLCSGDEPADAAGGIPRSPSANHPLPVRRPSASGTARCSRRSGPTRPPACRPRWRRAVHHPSRTRSTAVRRSPRVRLQPVRRAPRSPRRQHALPAPVAAGSQPAPPPQTSPREPSLAQRRPVLGRVVGRTPEQLPQICRLLSHI